MRRPVFTVALGLSCWLLTSLPAPAQDAEKEEIRFFTADQVELCGTFYPGSRGPKSPSVLLLHAVGGSRKDPGWEDLATALQKSGCAVLAFDFRGHGESTTVQREFWS